MIKEKMAKSTEVVCVECGKSNKSKNLYRKFEGGAVRLLFCIEWHLCVLYLLSDAYMKWSDINYCNPSNKTSTLSSPDHAVLEVEFYYIFLFQSCIEYLLYVCGLLFAIKVFCCFTSGDNLVSYRKILVSISLSSFGRLLVIPVVLWADPPSIQLYLWLIKLFVLTSNAQALKVALDVNFLKASALVFIGFLTSLLYVTLRIVLSMPTNHSDHLDSCNCNVFP